MSYAYGAKGAPAVGVGLPGLPRKAVSLPSTNDGELYLELLNGYSAGIPSAAVGVRTGVAAATKDDILVLWSNGVSGGQVSKIPVSYDQEVRTNVRSLYSVLLPAAYYSAGDFEGRIAHISDGTYLVVAPSSANYGLTAGIVTDNGASLAFGTTASWLGASAIQRVARLERLDQYRFAFVCHTSVLYYVGVIDLATGTPVFGTPVSGTSSSYATDLCVLDNGNILVGSKTATGTFTIRSYGVSGTALSAIESTTISYNSETAQGILMSPVAGGKAIVFPGFVTRLLYVVTDGSKLEKYGPTILNSQSARVPGASNASFKCSISGDTVVFATINNQIIFHAVTLNEDGTLSLLVWPASLNENGQSDTYISNVISGCYIDGHIMFTCMFLPEYTTALKVGRIIKGGVYA